MRKLFLKIFGEHPATDVTKMTMFSWHHILYLILIIGTIVLLTILFNKKEQSKKEKLLKIISILVLVVYLGDFFIQPFYNGGTMDANGELILDKFPFHICTVLCILIIFSKYCSFAKPIKTPVVVLSIIAPLMWLIFPGTALNSSQSAFSYEVIQLFVYHGLVFIYGCLALLLKETALDIKKVYKEACCIVGIALWATLGNLLYSSTDHDYNWFFLKDPVFGFIPKTINPFVVIIIFYLSCLLVYGIYYLIKKIKNRKVVEASN